MRSRRAEPSPGRALLELAKRAGDLAIEIRSALAEAEGRQWAEELIDRARCLRRDLEEAGVDVQLGRRELGAAPSGAEMPIIAAIESRSNPSVEEDLCSACAEVPDVVALPAGYIHPAEVPKSRRSRKGGDA